MVQFFVALFDCLVAREDEGQGLVEYALIIALVSIVAIAALGILGTNVTGALEEVAGSV